MVFTFRDKDDYIIKVLDYYVNKLNLKNRAEALDYLFYTHLKNIKIDDKELKKIIKQKIIDKGIMKMNRNARTIYGISNIKRSFYKQTMNDDVSQKQILIDFKELVNDLLPVLDGEDKKKLLKFKKNLTLKNVKYTRDVLTELQEKDGLSSYALNKIPISTIEKRVKQQVKRVIQFDKTQTEKDV